MNALEVSFPPGGHCSPSQGALQHSVPTMHLVSARGPSFVICTGCIKSALRSKGCIDCVSAPMYMFCSLTCNLCLIVLSLDSKVSRNTSGGGNRFGVSSPFIEKVFCSNRDLAGAAERPSCQKLKFTAAIMLIVETLVK